MDKETKYCLTAITIAIIWFLAQPIGVNMSVSADLEHVPYFNLTNSTISGNAEISGNMPIGTLLPLFIFDILVEISKIPILVMSGIITAGLIIYIFYTTRRSKYGKNT